MISNEDVCVMIVLQQCISLQTTQSSVFQIDSYLQLPESLADHWGFSSEQMSAAPLRYETLFQDVPGLELSLVLTDPRCTFLIGLFKAVPFILENSTLYSVAE